MAVREVKGNRRRDKQAEEEEEEEEEQQAIEITRPRKRSYLAAPLALSRPVAVVAPLARSPDAPLLSATVWGFGMECEVIRAQTGSSPGRDGEAGHF